MSSYSYMSSSSRIILFATNRLSFRNPGIDISTLALAPTESYKKVLYLVDDLSYSKNELLTSDPISNSVSDPAFG